MKYKDTIILALLVIVSVLSTHIFIINEVEEQSRIIPSDSNLIKALEYKQAFYTHTNEIHIKSYNTDIAKSYKECIDCHK